MKKRLKHNKMNSIWNCGRVISYVWETREANPKMLSGLFLLQ